MATEFIEKAAMRAPFSKQTGGTLCNTTNAPTLPYGWGADNGFESRWNNAAGTDVVRGPSGNSSDQFLLSEEGYTPMYTSVKFNISTAASISTQQFWIVPAGYRVVSITEIHATAESTASTLTGYVEKLSSGVAPGSGTALMTTFNLKATANTLQTATLSQPTTSNSSDPVLQLSAGAGLGWVQSAASTELAGVVVTLTLAPGGIGHVATYAMNANGDIADQ